MAFAPYRLTHRTDCQLEVIPSISRAVEFGLAADRRTSQAAAGNLGAGRPSLRAPGGDEAKAGRPATLTGGGRTVIPAPGRRGGPWPDPGLISPGQASLDFNAQRIELDPVLSPPRTPSVSSGEIARPATRPVKCPTFSVRPSYRLRQLEELRVLAELADSPPRQRLVAQELGELGGSGPVG